MHSTRPFLLFLLLAGIFTFGYSQTHTVGTISYQPQSVQEGYNLFFPHRQPIVFLTDACGQVVHSWPDTTHEPGEAVYLMEDGSLWVAKSRGDLSNPWIRGGGAGEKIEHRAWDNTLLWSYPWNDSLKRAHHDFQVLPNGNVILISWEWKTYAESIAAGRDTAKIPVGYLLPDYLVELQPIGTDSAQVVWEWHSWDHLIQDFDPTKANFGVVGDHPERIDLNFTNPMSTSDWLHTNSLHYHPQLDLLMLSVPVFNEIWIIDHSTTTAEAAGTTGGNSGRGGDLLYRWGNPLAYRRGTSSDQILGFQHNSHWLFEDVPPTDPYFGSVGVFNNILSPNVSAAQIFTPVFDSTTYAFAKDSATGTFLPLAPDWTYTSPTPPQITSYVVSSMQRLPNGNTLIFAGRKGYALEIDPLGNQVWEYVVPFNLGQGVAQGDVIPLSGNLTFRMRRYMPDFPGFAGRTLSPMGYLELNPDSAFCDSILLSLPAPTPSTNLAIWPNPASKLTHVEINGGPALTFHIWDGLGRKVWESPLGTQWEIDISHWPAGIYTLQAEGCGPKKLVVVGE